MAVDSGTPNVIRIDVKAVVYLGRTRQLPQLSKMQKRLGVRLLMIVLEMGVYEVEESDSEEEDAQQASGGYQEY